VNSQYLKNPFFQFTKNSDIATRTRHLLVNGTHILISATASKHLTSKEAFRQFADNLLRHHNLISVGNVYHTFDTGGFTCVICLTESHLALHTWPEYKAYTCDIYLCDYSRNNAELTQQLAREIEVFFGSSHVKKQVINR